MKSKKNSHTVILPDYACEKAGFTAEDTLELYVTNGILVLFKDNMTAMDMANTIDSLSILASDLIVELAAACGICDNCIGDESEEADIPLCDKLVDFSDEIGEITVKEAEVKQGVCDVPEGILTVLAASGACLAKLDDLIVSNSIIYGN